MFYPNDYVVSKWRPRMRTTGLHCQLAFLPRCCTRFHA
jgi:hypothetical protein